MTEHISDDELREIEERRERIRISYFSPDTIDVATCFSHDVPRLIAEVRRLNESYETRVSRYNELDDCCIVLNFEKQKLTDEVRRLTEECAHQRALKNLLINDYSESAAEVRYLRTAIDEAMGWIKSRHDGAAYDALRAVMECDHE